MRLPGFFALCNLLGPRSLNLFVRLFPSIYNCSLPNFLATKGVTSGFLARAVVNLIALFLPGFIFISFSTAHSPPQILLQLYYVVFICDFPIHYTIVSEESNTRVDVLPSIIYVH